MLNSLGMRWQATGGKLEHLCDQSQSQIPDSPILGFTHSLQRFMAGERFNLLQEQLCWLKCVTPSKAEVLQKASAHEIEQKLCIPSASMVKISHTFLVVICGTSHCHSSKKQHHLIANQSCRSGSNASVGAEHSMHFPFDDAFGISLA